MLSLVKQSYQAGWYTLDDVKTFVLANMITKDDYKQITGQDYVDASTSTSAGASESTNTDTSQA